MILRELLQGLDYQLIKGNLEDEIVKIHYDSREVEEKSLFVAIKGFKSDGHKFIPSAISKGAKAVIVEDVPGEMVEGITYVKIKDTRYGLSRISSNFYAHPSKKLKVIGITGTNGKTSTSIILKNMLTSGGKRVGIIGTIGYFIGDKRRETKHTTPESLDLQQIFAQMLSEGVEYVIMEVSSHAIALERVANTHFYKTVFTNLTQDHLDFHKDMMSYFNEKKKLFLMNKNKAFVNGDDVFGERLAEELKSYGRDVTTFGIGGDNDYQAREMDYSLDGVQFQLSVKGKCFNEPLNCLIPGRFSVYNVLCAASVALSEGITIRDIRESLKKIAVIPGRMEKLDLDTPYDVVIDFAHTPDGLQNVLLSLKDTVKQGRIITLFGCGGDRDKGKRPIMGKIAGTLSDLCIITSDNPRTERPDEIIDEILKGVKQTGCEYIVMENRREAIEYGLKIAKPSDVLLLAGKGHETYQIIGDTTIAFDERAIVKELLENDVN